MTTIHDTPHGIGDRQRARAGLGVERGAATRRQDGHDDHQAKTAAGAEVIRRHAAEQRSSVDGVLEAVGEVLAVDLLRHPGARHLAAELVALARSIRVITGKA